MDVPRGYYPGCADALFRSIQISVSFHREFKSHSETSINPPRYPRAVSTSAVLQVIGPDLRISYCKRPLQADHCEEFTHAGVYISRIVEEALRTTQTNQFSTERESEAWSQPEFRQSAEIS